jgi:hypothetical protein
MKQIVAQLRRQEAQLAKQLSGIREAISSLEFGSWAVPAPAITRRRSATKAKAVRKRRRFSAATIAKMRKAQQARWAKVKAAKQRA